ncbi:MAG: flagella synthesis protein FlgN [Massilia sp.]
MAITTPNTSLPAEQQLMASLVALMKQEQQVLVNADADGLAALMPQKTQLVQQAALLSAGRHKALGAAGFAAAESGMEPWLAANGAPEARAQWQRLLELTAEAKELNRVNGMLINKQMAHNQAVLNALRTPADGADPAAVYGPGGQPVAGGPSRRYVIG